MVFLGFFLGLGMLFLGFYAFLGFFDAFLGVSKGFRWCRFIKKLSIGTLSFGFFW